jgi:hypothetical protein
MEAWMKSESELANHISQTLDILMPSKKDISVASICTGSAIDHIIIDAFNDYWNKNKKCAPKA